MPTLRDVMDAVTERDKLLQADLYDSLAPLYDFERERMRDYDAVADYVERCAPADAQSVAVGACGTGVLLSRLESRFEEVIGFDRSPAMLALARERTDAPLVAADLRNVVAPGHFDVVTVLGGSIAHLPAGSGEDDGVRAALSSAYESLRPGGVFLCDFMQRGTLESGRVSEETFESDRFAVDRTVITTGEEQGSDSLGATARYTFAYEITDRTEAETVRIGTSTTVREFGVPQLLGAALNVGFSNVTLPATPTHGSGFLATRPE